MRPFQLLRRLTAMAVVLMLGVAPTAFGQITVNGSGSYATIQAAIDAAPAGATIFIPNGSYAENPIVRGDDSGLTIEGESEAGVIIQPSGANYGFTIEGDGTTLRMVTIDGTGLTGGSGYGIKANGPDTYPGSEDRLVGLTVEDVTVFGSSRSEVDLNGVDNATLQRLTLNGQGTSGNALGVTDGNNIVIDDIDTDGQNTWGGIALYTYGRFFFPGIRGIAITNTDGVLETAPLYQQISYYDTLQSDPAPYLVTDLEADEYGFTVTNPTFRAEGPEYTFFFRSEAEANAFAASLSTPDDSEVGTRDTDPYDGAINGNDLRPLFECVALNNAPNPNGGFTARFGYLNERGEAIRVDIGNQNKITGGGLSGQDQGQPVVFQYPAPDSPPGQPGRTSYDGHFSVDFNGSNLVWTLNGRTVTANSGAKACPEDCDFSARPAWPSGEIFSNGDGTGYFEVTAANGFTQVALVTEDSDNIALVELQDELGNPVPNVSGSGNLNGSLGSGFIRLTYDGPAGANPSGTFRVIVRQLEPGTSSFMFRVLDRCGYTLQVDPVVDLGGTALNSESVTEAGSYALAANSPNPFSARTKISFSLEAPTRVTLRIYDVLGRVVDTLVDTDLEAGTHESVWNGRTSDGSSVASGVYFYRIEAGAFSATRQMTVVR